MAAPIVVTDFDGTLALADVFDELCDRFAAPDWREFERRFTSGELSMLGAAQWIFGSVNASLAELRDYALRVGELRAGASDLFEAARTGRIELVIASGGLGFYIEALLAEHLPYIRAVYCTITWFATSFGDKRRGTMRFVATLQSPNLALGDPKRRRSSTLA